MDVKIYRRILLTSCGLIFVQFVSLPAGFLCWGVDSYQYEHFKSGKINLKGMCNGEMLGVCKITTL